MKLLIIDAVTGREITSTSINAKATAESSGFGLMDLLEKPSDDPEQLFMTELNSYIDGLYRY